MVTDGESTKHPSEPMRSAFWEGTKEAVTSEWLLQALSSGPRKTTAEVSDPELSSTGQSVPSGALAMSENIYVLAALGRGQRCSAS